MRPEWWSVPLTILAGFWLVVLVGLPLYVFPPVADPPPSDVVMVLGPPMDARLEVAERLHAEGLAERIVISVQPERGQTIDDIALCQEPEVTCRVPEPYNTRGEALMMADIAGADAATTSVIVVTTAPHIARTRYLFDKCYPGPVTVIEGDRPTTLSAWTVQYLYQTAAFPKAIFEPCR